jgi:hypothetical protein
VQQAFLGAGAYAAKPRVRDLLTGVLG